LELRATSDDIVLPGGNIRGRPGDGDPRWRNTSVGESFLGLLESGREDELTFPSATKVSAGATNSLDGDSKTIDFLTGENGERLMIFEVGLLGRVPCFLEVFEESASHGFDTGLSITRSGTCTTRLTIDDGVESVGGLLGTVGDIGVGVHAEDLRRIVVGVGVENVLAVLGELVEGGK